MMEQSAYLQVEFPFIGDALNDVATHPALADAARRFIGSREVVLSQSAIWAKYADTDTYGSDLHVDFEGNTLVVPREDGDYRQLNAIVYYTDITLDTGPTYVVPVEHSQGSSLWPPHRTREDWPALYASELPMLCAAGSVLLFTMSTFHRASPVLDPLTARFSHHFVFRSPRHPFAGYHLWSRFGERPEMQHFITRATPEQRTLVGFPPPGDAYWTEQTIAGVAERYPTMDLRAYRQR
jgi:ectoine hydroxylase-related dioxygenase (phytanoyl-CoA dioxygenase family)